MTVSSAIDNNFNAVFDATCKRLGADPDFGDALNCDLLYKRLSEMHKAGFNVEAFLAKQTEFYAMCSEVSDLYRKFKTTGGVLS